MVAILLHNYVIDDTYRLIALIVNPGLNPSIVNFLDTLFLLFPSHYYIASVFFLLGSYVWLLLEKKILVFFPVLQAISKFETSMVASCYINKNHKTRYNNYLTSAR